MGRSSCVAEGEAGRVGGGVRYVRERDTRFRPQGSSDALQFPCFAGVATTVTELDIVVEEYKTTVTRCLLPILNFGRVDVDGLSMLELQAAAIAKLLKGRELLPRQVLNEIYQTVGIIRGELPHRKDDEHRQLEQTANKLEMIFWLILKGECLDDRVPGVPRTI